MIKDKIHSKNSFSKTIHTAIQFSSDLPYRSSNAFLMSPKSISLRDTMIRINVRSFVPMPCILAYNRSAKNPTFDFTHFTVDQKLRSFISSHMYININEKYMEIRIWVNTVLMLQKYYVHTVFNLNFRHLCEEYTHVVTWIFACCMLYAMQHRAIEDPINVHTIFMHGSTQTSRLFNI